MRSRPLTEPLRQGIELPQGLVRRVSAHDGGERSWLLYEPARSEGSMRPVVIVLHGAGANGLGAYKMSGLRELADQEGFAAVFPDGQGPAPDRFLFWNSGGRSNDRFRSDADDTGFLEALCDELVAEHRADPRRVYFAGFSNGAMMCHRFACERAVRVAALAAVAGAIPEHCLKTGGAEVPALLIHGTADEYVRPGGGRPSKGIAGSDRVDLPLAEAVRYWVERNGCAVLPEESAAGMLRTERYHGGRNGSEVVVHRLVGQGHAWPGGRPGIEYGNLDEPSGELSASAEMWGFFKQHRRCGGS